ncbi:MAG: hypothetical protein WCJ58_08575 [bacterium]
MNDLTISNLNDDENLTPVSTKEEFLQYVAINSGQERNKLQNLIDKDDWTIMQRIFGPRDLIKIAKDQRITQVKSGFDLINTCDQIVHEVVVGAIRNRAEAVLTSDWIKLGSEIKADVVNTLESLLKNLSVSRERFSDFIIEEGKKAEKYKDDIETYAEFKKSVADDRQVYFTNRSNQINSFQAKIQAIEDKFKKL